MITRCIVSLLCFCVSLNAATYFVRKDGLDSHTGTADNAAGAWLTIGKAASVVNPGDTVYVRQGVYNEQVTLTRSGTEANRIAWFGERDASGNWLTIIDASVASTGWTLAGGSVDPNSYGVYKHTALPFRPGSIFSNNKGIPEFCATGRDPVTTSAGVSLTPSGTPLNASPTAIRNAGVGGSGEYWDGLEACWHWQTNTSTAFLRFRNGDNPNTSNLRIFYNGGVSGIVVNRAPVLIRASWNTWHGFHVRNAHTCIAIQPTSGSLVGSVIESNSITGTFYPIQLVRIRGSGTLISSNAVVYNTIRTNLFAGETGGAWANASAATWTQYHTYLWNKNQGSAGGSDYSAILLFDTSASNRVSGNVITGVDQGIKLYNWDVPSSYIDISSNQVSKCSGAAVYWAFGNGLDMTMLHDNRISDTYIHFRHQRTRDTLPGGVGWPQARVYVFRNVGWNPVGRGSWWYLHWEQTAYLGFANAQTYAYHNSFEGGQYAVNISSLDPAGYSGARFFNNVINTPNTIAAETYPNMQNATSLTAFDYNRIREIQGSPPWYGSHNELHNSYEFGVSGAVPSSMPASFELPPGSTAISKGPGVHQPFSLQGVSYPAMPGFPSVYYSGTLADLGAVPFEFDEEPPPNPITNVLSITVSSLFNALLDADPDAPNNVPPFFEISRADVSVDGELVPNTTGDCPFTVSVSSPDGAVEGVDYTVFQTSGQINNGSNSTGAEFFVVVKSLRNPLFTGQRRVRVTLEPGAAYGLSGTVFAEAILYDADLPPGVIIRPQPAPGHGMLRGPL